MRYPSRYFIICTLHSLIILIGLLAKAHGIEAPLWQQFVSAKKANTEPTLPDFSYAGYHYSESEIPNTSTWKMFNVTSFGAIPNDNKYDDKAIQSAINAAEAAGGGVVFFPKGRFMISPNENVGENIFIRGSNIVLKGSGSNANGTEIFKHHKKVKNGRYIVEITPKSTEEKTLTQITKNAQRESFIIEVANTSKLFVGQKIVIRADSVEFAKDHYAPQKIYPKWERILDKGFRLRELHTVAAINGQSVYLKEPLHINLDVSKTTIKVRDYPMISNVGVEDILFKGNWNNYPEKFKHHKNDIHDYAWNALRLDNVTNGWIRNVTFKDWNQGLFIDGSSAITVDNILFSGKKGHSSVHVRRSYGVLIKDSKDTAGHHHGPGIGYWGAGTVYLRYTMLPEQNMDSHSGSPYATLFDNVTNGHFNKNGGPHASYSHHGKYFVAWNMFINGGPDNYDFWREKRNGHTFAMPFFVGLQGKKVTMKRGTYSANELAGQAAEPNSLFEAQLKLRLSQRGSD